MSANFDDWYLIAKKDANQVKIANFAIKFYSLWIQADQRHTFSAQENMQLLYDRKNTQVLSTYFILHALRYVTIPLIKCL